MYFTYSFIGGDILEKVIDIFKGALMGIANVIPGLSGGTIAVAIGIYEKLINAIADILKHPIKAGRRIEDKPNDITAVTTAVLLFTAFSTLCAVLLWFIKEATLSTPISFHRC